MLYCVGQFKIKKTVVQQNEHFLPCWERKSLEMLVDLRNPMPKPPRSIFSRLCHKHVGSSSKMELVVEPWCLDLKQTQYANNIYKRSNIFCDRNTNQAQVPRNVISPPQPHPIPRPKHTLHDIEVYNSKKWEPFWGGESADSQKGQWRSAKREIDCKNRQGGSC